MGINKISRIHGNMYLVKSGQMSFQVSKSVPNVEYWTVRQLSTGKELYANAALDKCFDHVDDLTTYSPS